MPSRRIERLLLGPLLVGETLPEGHREVVNGEQRVDPILPLLAETLVGGAGVGEAGVATRRRDHDTSQDRTHRGFGPPGDIAVPIVRGVLVLGGGLDLDDLGVALLADGERMNLEITEPATAFLDRDWYSAVDLIYRRRRPVIGRTSIAMASPVR